MEKTIEIPEGYEARIEGNKVILEPKEIEDERIRKQLIGFFSGRYALCNINTKDAIAYLEKQKEQKPESCDCSRDEESYMNGIHHVLMNPEAYGLIKQKPASISYNHENDSKPAEWSEEDETCLEDALWCVMKTRHFVAKDACDLDACRSAERWLKSLRPQPITYVLDEPLGYDNDLNPIYPPINHWKPSDEQMEALKDAFRKDGGNEYRKVINSLYCDLQKLL